MSICNTKDMQFLKPTKAKLIMTIIFFLLIIATYSGLSFFSLSDTSMCLPTMPVDNPTPTPTMAPLNVHDVINDMPLVDVTHSDCQSYDTSYLDSPSYAVASNIVNTIKLLFVFVGSYVISCFIIFTKTRIKNREKMLQEKYKNKK